jgi:cellulose synthase/poly-beta-1,6-N-acetylglucosamine synthase-like glycosyltransferase
LAIVLLLIHAVFFVIVLWGQSQTKRLPVTVGERDKPWPKVSIVIAARDEEAEIEQALRSVLELDYPEKEIVVVNDRSKDATGEILARMQQQHPELKVVTVTELPKGWIGKNHALHLGAGQSAGDLLLFTDADVVYKPESLKKAVEFMEREKLDHLTMNPQIWSRSWPVNAMIVMFARAFTIYMQPWRARDPKSTCYIGIGAFNLVRRVAYDQIGGHTRIALRPDDDIRLGQILKKNGFRQDIVEGLDDLSVAWYPTLWAFVRGLEKNVLAGTDYRLGKLMFDLTMMLSIHLGPWVTLIFGDVPTQILSLLALVISMVSYSLFCKFPKISPLTAIVEPLTVVFLVFTFGRSGLLTIWRGGIYWRDTFYPLDELRRNTV